MQRKYGLTDETKEVDGRTLYRIMALKDFKDVKKGDFGGWVQHDENLSHDGDCWIYKNGMVYGLGEVCEHALVTDSATVCDHAKAKGHSVIFGNAKVYEHATLYDRSAIYGDSRVHGNASVNGHFEIRDNADVFGDAYLYGNGCIAKYGYITSATDVMTVTHIARRHRAITFYRAKDGPNTGIYVNGGCFDDISEFNDVITMFERKVERDFGDSIRGEILQQAAVLARLQLASVLVIGTSQRERRENE